MKARTSLLRVFFKLERDGLLLGGTISFSLIAVIVCILLLRGLNRAAVISGLLLLSVALALLFLQVRGTFLNLRWWKNQGFDLELYPRDKDEARALRKFGINLLHERARAFLECCRRQEKRQILVNLLKETPLKADFESLEQFSSYRQAKAERSNDLAVKSCYLDNCTKLLRDYKKGLHLTLKRLKAIGIIDQDFELKPMLDEIKAELQTASSPPAA